ncbi:MAG: holo-ACP synthase [Thermodesulfobacteriota bacterium]
MIEGLGIEIVEVERFNSALQRWGPSFYRRLFTAEELRYCLSKRSPAPHLAARFAAKIGFFKAAGRRIPFCGISVVRDKRGRPAITLRGAAGATVRSSLTISHTRETAMAVVLVEKES